MANISRRSEAITTRRSEKTQSVGAKQKLWWAVTRDDTRTFDSPATARARAGRQSPNCHHFSRRPRFQDVDGSKASLSGFTRASTSARHSGKLLAANAPGDNVPSLSRGKSRKLII